jgi:hypothetical protein
MRRSEYGSRVAWLGFFTAACDLIGAYPSAIGPLAMLVCQLFFAGWFAAVGASLFRMRRPATAAPRRYQG